MKIIRRGRRVLLFLMAMHFLVVDSGVAADVEGLLTEINQKPSEERRKILTDGAKKERVVYYYGSTSMGDMQDLFKGFSQQYPFIEVRYN